MAGGAEEEQHMTESDSGTGPISRGPNTLRWELQNNFIRLSEKIGHTLDQLGLITPGHPFALASEYSEDLSYAPLVTLIFYGTVGSINIEFWGEMDDDSILTTSAVYSQGLDGSLRGKGRQTFEITTRMIASLAALLEKTITHLTVTHNSSHHLPIELGYDTIGYDELRMKVGASKQNRFLARRLNTVRRDNSHLNMRTFTPEHSGFYPFNQDEIKRMQKVLEKLWRSTTPPIPTPQQ